MSNESQATAVDQQKLKSYVEELTEGDGYILLPQLFAADDIAEARRIIMEESSKIENTVTHFQGGNEKKMHLQRRVWNLLNKGEVFVKMVQHPVVMQIVGSFLGDEFCLGSIAANRILPGGPGQQPHVDYPYWDMYKRKSFPNNINASYPLNCQVTVLLDDFTADNGATAVMPGTQKLCRYPDADDEKRFFKEAKRMTGKAGDVAIFFGLVWHCAMPNESRGDRNAVLIQYLPKFIKPMEDQKNGVNKSVVEKATPVLKRLLGFDYPYPQLLETAGTGNTEGRS